MGDGFDLYSRFDAFDIGFAKNSGSSQPKEPSAQAK